jgi:hypothetical protein
MGAFATMPSMDACSGGRRPGAWGPAQVDLRAQNLIRQTQDTMREIADRTGGRAFLNTNDLAGSIRRAMDDARITYTLAYTPSHNEWDGKFRELKIKVNRPGIDVRYRKGYYAYPDSPNDPKHRQAVLLEALVTPLASTGLSLAAAAPVKPTDQNPRTFIRALLDTREIGFQFNAAGKQEATLDIYLAVFDEKGKVLNQVAHTVRMEAEQAKYQELIKTGITVTADSESPARSTRARLVVLDVASGLVGSVDVPLK